MQRHKPVLEDGISRADLEVEGRILTRLVVEWLGSSSTGRLWVGEGEGLDALRCIRHTHTLDISSLGSVLGGGVVW